MQEGVTIELSFFFSSKMFQNLSRFLWRKEWQNVAKCETRVPVFFSHRRVFCPTENYISVLLETGKIFPSRANIFYGARSFLIMASFLGFMPDAISLKPDFSASGRFFRVCREFSRLSKNLSFSGVNFQIINKFCFGGPILSELFKFSGFG